MPGPKVQSETDVDADVEAHTTVDDGLAKLYETYQKRESVANTQLVMIVEYVRDNKLSRKTVKATLEDRGLTPSSVSTEVSRIMSLTLEKNREILEKLADNEITIAAARKALVGKKQANPAKDPPDKLWEMLYRAAKYAYKESAILTDFTLKYFTSEAANAWNQVKDEYEQKAREAQEAAEAEVPAEEEEVEEGAAV